MDKGYNISVKIYTTIHGMWNKFVSRDVGKKCVANEFVRKEPLNCFEELISINEHLNFVNVASWASTYVQRKFCAQWGCWNQCLELFIRLALVKS